MVKKDQLYAVALIKRKWIVELFQNGCYGIQPHPFKVVFCSIDSNTSCSFTKQDLSFKQAYFVSFCVVLCNEPKFWQLTLVFSTYFALQPVDKSCSFTWQMLKCYDFLVYCVTKLLIFSPSFRNLSWIPSKVEMLEWSQLKSTCMRKMHFKFLDWWIKHLTSHQKL